MADLQKTIEIVFGAVDNTGGVIKEVGRQIEGIAEGADKITGPLADATKAILAFEAGVAALGVAVLGYSLSAAVDFAAAQTQLNKSLTESEGSAAQYGDQILEISNKLGVSQTSVVELAAEFKQSGKSIEDSLKLAAGALEAVKIGEVDVTEASAILNSTLRGFGLEADSVTRVLDALNGVSNTNGVTFRELATAIGDIAPLAKVTGFSLEEMSGLLTPIIERFGSGSESARGLRTALLNLASPTATVVDGLAGVGIELLDTEGRSRGAKVVLEELAAVWPKLSDNVKTATAAQVAGKDQAVKFISVLDNWETVLKATADAYNPVITATEELAIKLASPEEVIARLGVSFDNAAIAIGQKFLPEAIGVASAATDINNAFANVVSGGGLEPLFSLLRPLLVEFQDKLRTIAVNLPEAFAGLDFTKLVAGFEKIGSSIGELFGGLDLSTAEGLEVALQKIIDLGAGFLNFSAGVVDSLKPVFDLFLAGADAASKADSGLIEFLGNIGGLASGVQILLPVMETLGTVVTGVGTALTGLAGAKTLGLLDTSLLRAATSSGALSTALGAAGLVAAVGFAAKEIYDLISAASQLNEQLDREQVAAESAAANQERLSESLASLSSRTGLAISTMGDFNAAVESGALVFDLAQGAWVRADQAVGQLAGSVSDGSDSWTDYGEELNHTVLPLDNVADSAEKTADAVSRADASIKSASDGYGELADKLISSRQEGDLLIKTFEGQDGSIRIVRERVQGLATDTAKLSKDEAEAAKASEALRVKLLELASEERIAQIKATVELNSAQIEADVRRVEAAFDSLNTGIESTGELIGKLGGVLGGLEPNTRGYNDIKEILDKEVKLREKEFQLQEKLTESQLKLIEARRQALERGDALVTINADNLSGHMEAFLYELLQLIQVRATEEGQQWLGLLNCTG